MRKSMRPVNLGRIVDITRISQNYDTLNIDMISNILSTSENHSEEILDEMCDMNLLMKSENGYLQTEYLSKFRDAIIVENWNAVHSLFLNHAHYKSYYEKVCDFKIATLEDIYKSLIIQEYPHFNKTSIDVVADWAERIGSVQRNVFTGNIYPVLKENVNFKDELLEGYNTLNYSYNQFLKQTYVEIPKLRETICQKCFMSRLAFDEQLKSLFLNNIGILELSGAPINSHAKKTTKKIKHVTLLPYSDRLSMKLTSDQYLSGLEINKKMYYYLAYHGGNLNE